MRFRVHLSVLAAIAGLLSLVPQPAAAGYAMYVWSMGFDSTIPGCGAAELEAEDPACETHNWETPEARQWLWDTANRPGREIDRLFISDIRDQLEDPAADDDCSAASVLAVKQMLIEAHCKVPGVKIYATFSGTNPAVTEQDRVPEVVWYNDNCAGAPNARFDGVAINNEAYGPLKCAAESVQQDYLENLQAAQDAAQLQVTGDLLTHYSIGWHWGECDDVMIDIDWEGSIQPATHHMIDIFDSVDVQIATTNPLTVPTRANQAGYAHAVGQGKEFYILSFTNKRPDAECTTTHFPYYCSAESTNPRRKDDWLMENIFDEFATMGIPSATPAIHAFRNVYSTGAHPDWPSYYSGSVHNCIPVAFQGPMELADPDGPDDEIGWPAQGNATVYELAKSIGDPTFDTGCRIAATTPETHATDPERPLPRTVFYYLVRAVEPEPQGWGESSDGTPRQFFCQ
ncbi:MAG: hypothetical protein GY716_04170 [bacterium]|nr:hypothetical protein [bacterium]